MYSTTHVAKGLPTSLPLAAKTQSPSCYLHTAVLKSYIGEQAAFVYSSLYSYSRLTLQQLGQRTHLKPRLLKQLLVTLIQLGCVVFTVDKLGLASKKTVTYYEVNDEGCWKLVYADQILSIIGQNYGSVGAEIIQNILMSGHLTLGDYNRNNHHNKSEVKSAFVKLVDDKWIVPVKQFETLSKNSIFADCVKLATKEYNSQNSNGGGSGGGDYGPPGNGANGGPGGMGNSGKPKVVSQMRRAMSIKEIAKEKFIQRMQDQEQKNRLHSFNEEEDNDDADTNNEISTYDNYEADISKDLNPKIPLTLNFERVLKHIRSNHLISAATHRIGRISSQVYELALRRLEERSRDIRLVEDVADKLVSGIAISMGNATSATMGLSTGAVQAMSSGLGGTTQGYDPINGADLERSYELKDQERGLNFGAMDILKEMKRYNPLLIHDLKGTICDGNEELTIGSKRKSNDLNSGSKKKIRLDSVKFEDEEDKEDQEEDAEDEDDSDNNLMTLILQHLKLLTTDKQIPFLMESNPGSYYIPMTLIQGKLPVYEMKQEMRITLGSQALRIINCIEKKRLIDEKAISKEVLMKEIDVRRILTSLLKFGFIEIQEIPRTADRSAIRAAFAYRICSSVGMLRDSHSNIGHTMKGAYTNSMALFGKSMMHLMGEAIDSLIHMRAENKILLDKVSREDVRGNEGDLLLESEMKQLKNVLEQERLALAQWTRLRTMGELFWFFKCA